MPAPKNDLDAIHVLSVLRYEPATGRFVWRSGRKVGQEAGYVDGRYVKIWINGRSWLAHRLAWLFVYGCWPVEILDHVDGDGTNNRIANLREATASQNQQNRRRAKHKPVGHKGAFLRKDGRWTSSIQIEGRVTRLGYFPSAEDAHAAYQTEAAKRFGEFARFD